MFDRKKFDESSVDATKPSYVGPTAKSMAEAIEKEQTMHAIKKAMCLHSNPNLQYLELVHSIRTCGVSMKTAGEVCYRLICCPYVFDRTPLVSVRRTAWKTALREWEWFMSGSNRIEDLHPSAHPWWRVYTNENGHVPFNYSMQFREYCGTDIRPFDQIAWFIDAIKNHPFSRRTVITTWNTADMVNPLCPITNCHGTVIQAFVDPSVSGTSSRLHLVTYQRSCDTICGVPHNWVQYWAFLLWLSHLSGLKPGTLTWIGGDTHLYSKHDGLVDQLTKLYTDYCDPEITDPVIPQPPELVYSPSVDDDDGKFRADDFTLNGGYMPIITERAEMIVGTKSGEGGHRT